MDVQPNLNLGARSHEDIALDLLKFVSVTAGVGRPAAPSTGFSGSRRNEARRTCESVARALQPLPEGSQRPGARDGAGKQRAGAAKQAAARMDGPTVSQSSLRVAVAGAGAFGKNHLRVYRELETAGQAVALVAAVEPDATRAAETAAKYAIPVFATVDELLAADLHLNAATVAVPTVHHHAVASVLLDAGLDLLVEKPLAASLAEADDLVQRADKGSRILQPGPPGALQSRGAGRSAATAPAHVFRVAPALHLHAPRFGCGRGAGPDDSRLGHRAHLCRLTRARGACCGPADSLAESGHRQRPRRVRFRLRGELYRFQSLHRARPQAALLRAAQYVSIDYARQDLLVIRVDGGMASPRRPN